MRLSAPAATPLQIAGIFYAAHRQSRARLAFLAALDRAMSGGQLRHA